MIQYTLKCDQGHKTDSWFQSASAYDVLERSGHLSCAQCGSSNISKALMAPRVNAVSVPDEPVTQVLNNPANDVEKAIAELRSQVEAHSDYVGDQFVSEARAMHLGDKPERSIYGEAPLEQAKALIEDGVPLMPLPFRPKQKMT